MKATVRKVEVGTCVKTSNFQDAFAPGMEKYIGKEIDVLPINGKPGWYNEDDWSWWFHESWLDFEPQSPRRNEGVNMNSIPKGYKQVFEGLIKEGDLLSVGSDNLVVAAAHMTIGSPVEGITECGIEVKVYRNQPSYTKELRKAIRKHVGEWKCEHIDTFVKCIQRLNKKHFGER